MATINLWAGDGIVLVGPSGAGKSVIYNYLTKGIIEPSKASTGVREKRRSGGSGRLLSAHYVDTPGSMYHVALDKELYEYMRTKKPEIVAIVLAYGYLSNVDTRNALVFEVARGVKEYGSVPDYQKAGLYKEVEWLLQVSEKVPSTEFKSSSLMIIVNKQDLWGDCYDKVMSYYKSELGSIQEAIEKIRSSWCSNNCQPTFHSVAGLYDCFKEKMQPTASMSIKKAKHTLMVLRALIRLKLARRW
jgi:energy-coupling factor transporter ATP-binding protein EcfA2